MPSQMKEWNVFIKVVEKGAVTRAAKEMSMVPSAVSKIITKLESELKTTLFDRHSRTLTVTPSGLIIYRKVKEIISLMDDLVSEAQNSDNIVRGTLRLAVPTVVGEYMANEWVYEFLQRRKQVKIFLDTMDVFVNDAIESNDLILKTGEIENDLLVHKRLSPLKLILCASPAYLSSHKKINEPADLEEHSVFPLFHHGLAGPITLFKGEESYTLQGVNKYQFSSNNLVSLLNLVLKGYGISVATPGWLAAQKLYNNQVEIVLPEWKLPELPVYLIWKQRQFYTPLFKEFSNFIADKWNNRPYVR